MVFRIIFGIALVLTLHGCATTARKANNQLEMKVSELENQLEQKDDQIRSLEMELENTRASARPAAAPVKTDVSKVSKKEIQAALKNAGYYNGAIDAKIGQGTKAAIKEFQNANGLKADGVVGSQTWLKLSEYLQ